MTLFEPDDDSYTVSSLGQAVTTAIRSTFPGEIWVRGEIRDLNRASSGHVYFRLVEAGASDRRGGTVLASLAVMLGAQKKGAVNRTLREAGAGRLVDGTQVKLRGRIDWYAPRGSLQLRMTGVDPVYTLGQLAAERAAVVTALRADDLFDANRRLALALLPLRVGLVTSLGSDAERDVLDQLSSSGLGFDIRCFDVRVQGEHAPASVASAIAALDGIVDVIVVARGGGGATDLQAFDTDRVARAIAMSATPVITGIGHEADVSVADEVAHSFHKTPTAVAQHLVDLVRESHGRVEESWNAIAGLALVHLDAHADRIDRAAERATRASHGATDRQSNRLERIADRIAAAAPHRLERAADATSAAEHRLVHSPAATLRVAGQRVDALATQVRLLDPARLLARGWSITRDEHGVAIRSVADVEIGATIITTVADGELTGSVTRTTVSSPDDDHSAR